MVSAEEQSVGNTPEVAAARRAVAAAEAVSEAAEADPETPKPVRVLAGRALEESRAALAALRRAAEEVCESPSRGKSRSRQTFAEFTTLLGEEVKEVAEESVQEGIKYAERSLRKAKSLIEDHFKVDDAFRMLGPLRQDSNLARDVHDWFNIVALVPVIVLNIMNWSLPTADSIQGYRQIYAVPQLWHGEAFPGFWWCTFLYFALDVLFILVLPRCVRSPGVILQHHFATIGYILIPKLRPQYGWLMGACMIVEVNTWFLIARRLFNKNGDKPFAVGVALVKSVRILAVSFCFYVSWFLIRVGFYPLLLMVIVQEWWKESTRLGTPINLIAISPVMQCVFIFLNLKWTVDLIRSKLKGRGSSKGL